MFKETISADRRRLEFEIEKLGAHPYAKKVADRGIPLNVKIKSISAGAANILKQEALASGIDAVVHQGTVSCDIKSTDVLICGDVNGLKRLISKLKLQPFGLKDVAAELEKLLEGREKLFCFRGEKITFEEKRVMAIINITPDSFSDGGRFLELNNVEVYLNKLKGLGIELVDIGGESTRPGSEPVGVDEELKRVLPVVEMAVDMGFVVSVDTYKSKVAEECLKRGAHIINDISGFCFDEDMPKVCADYDAGVCLMHIKGTPKTMQNNPKYDNLLEEVKYQIYKSMEKGVKSGISEENMMIDPGFGFGKTLEDNYLILKYLKEFEVFGRPILVGVSRKSMIGNIINKTVDQRVIGSKVVETMALVNGADIIRTHDVAEAIDMMKIFNFYHRVGLEC